ncbi:hypothetical protein AAC387_Pa02g5156 [Persea americana]
MAEFLHWTRPDNGLSVRVDLNTAWLVPRQNLARSSKFGVRSSELDSGKLRSSGRPPAQADLGTVVGVHSTPGCAGLMRRPPLNIHCNWNSGNLNPKYLLWNSKGNRRKAQY